MSNGSEENLPQGHDKSAENAASEGRRVERTRLEIDLGDLIEPLVASSAEPANSSKTNASQIEPETKKVAKTLPDPDAATLSQIIQNQNSISDLPSQNDSQRNELPLDQSGARRVAKTEIIKPTNVPPLSDSQKSKLPLDQSGARRVAKTELNKPANIPSMTESQRNKLPLDQSGGRRVAKTELVMPANIPPLTESQRNVLPQDQSGARRVAKTMLDSEISESLGELSLTPEPVAPKAPRTMSKHNAKLLKAKRISNTMLDVGLQMQAMEPLTESLAEPRTEDVVQVPVNQPAPKPKIKKAAAQQFVPKTMLDHNMLFRAVESSSLREEAKVAALVEERASQPAKFRPAPIKADRQSSPCPFVWAETDSKERFRYCTNCQTAIYDLAGLEQSEVDALIFKRENRDKYTLYGREDGKFSTSNCPVEARRKKSLIMAVIVAVALLIGVVTILLLMPKPDPETVSESPSDTTSNTVTTKKSGTAGGGNHIQTFKFPDAKSGDDGSQDSEQVHDPDEDGSFWKFDNAP